MKLMQIIGLLAIVFAFTHASDDKNKVNVGDVVSDFALTDLNGKLVKLSDFKGKVVVLEWTNPNCPFVQRVYREKIMTSVQKRVHAERRCMDYYKLNESKT